MSELTRPGLWVLLLMLLGATTPVCSEEPEVQPRVVVTAPFLELRTGPGQGYPVFHAVEQGETIELLSRKTSWFRVRDRKGREGWAPIEEIRRTAHPDGSPVAFDEPRFDDFRTRRWEVGVMTGDFEGATVNALYGGYWWTDNLSTELWGSQIIGNFSDIAMVNVNILHQPFPSWRISPFFTLGTGLAYIDPKSTLVQTEKRDEDTLHYGFGLRLYASDRYFVRAEYKDYLVFTDRERNEKAQEWKIGLSTFF